MPDEKSIVGNGWEQWKNHVLIELKDNKSDHHEIKQFLSRIDRSIAMLEVKSGIWGLVGGLIPATIALVWVLYKTS